MSINFDPGDGLRPSKLSVASSNPAGRANTVSVLADIFKFPIFSRRARVGMRVRICGQRGSQSIHVNGCFQVQTFAMPSRLHL